MKQFRIQLIELLIVLAVAFVILPGCSPQQIKADIELKVANDVKPLALKDAADIVTISNQFVPAYQPGLDCGNGAIAWLNSLPPPPTASSLGLPNVCSATNIDPNCTNIDGVGSLAVYTHLKATQAQAAPAVTLPKIDDTTLGGCFRMFTDAGNDVNQAVAKAGALFGGLALGKGALSASAAKAFAAGLAAPKP
jgi:hypothetical protein